MKKSSAIYYSDIIQLVKLYAKKPTTPYIFDPYNRLVYDNEELDFSEDGDQILVNLASQITEYKGMPLSSFNLILDFGKANLPQNFCSQTLNYINQPEGNMRWLYESGNLKSVLAFYNASGKRGSIISKGIQLLSFFGLERFAAKGTLTIYAKEALKLNQSIQQNCDAYSIFMGTPGLQRSILVALLKKQEVVQFLKIPTNAASTNLIQNEKKALLALQDNPSSYIHAPKIINPNLKNELLLENVKVPSSLRTSSFTSIHQAFIVENISENAKKNSLSKNNFWVNTKAIFYDAGILENAQLIELKALGKKLIETIDEKTSISTTWAHGDFTPWNMYVNHNKIALYDWEMYREEAPALFDLFHFHYQKGILMDHTSSKEILYEIEQILKSENIEGALKKAQINTQLCHQLYLLTTIAYFIEVYSHQNLTIQNQWQLNCWRGALKNEIDYSNNGENYRLSFIHAVNSELKNIQHAFLKFDFESLDAIPESSDLDLAIEQKGIQKIITLCENSPLVLRYNHRKKSFMSTIEVHFKNNQFLSLDLIHKFKRKELTLLPAKELLGESYLSEKGVKLPSVKHDLAYAYSFYTLNDASIPLRYHSYFSNHDEATLDSAVKYINTNYNTSFDKLSSVFTLGLDNKELVRESLLKNSKLEYLTGKLNYIKDTLSELFKNRGFMVTFSGVDGAGKSTVIDLVKYNIERKYRKDVVLLRHRPGILPILSAMKHGKSKAEKIAGETLPRKGKNKNKLSSALRFTYYYSDYLFGQIYVYFRYILRGKVVLYDRYYFDFINDAKRSNIQINRRFSKALYSFVMKPKLNIFLYAEAETILARKQELNASEINELSNNYRSLFNALKLKSKKCTYTSIENIQLDETINTVLNEFAKVA